MVDSFITTLMPSWLWVGKPCVVREHEGRVVYAPDDQGELYTMSKEGRLSNPFGQVALRDDMDRGTVGLACPDCTNLVLGIGSGEPDDSQYAVDNQGNVVRRK